MTRKALLGIVLVVLVFILVGSLTYTRRQSTNRSGTATMTVVPDALLGTTVTTIAAKTATTPNQTLQLPTGASSTAALTLRKSADGKKLSVYNDNRNLFDLPWPLLGASKRVAFVGSVVNFVYVGRFPESYDGYMLFPIGAQEIVRIDANTGVPAMLKGTSDELVYALTQNISGEVKLALLDYTNRALHVKTADGKLLNTISFPDAYTQIGEVYFSADGTKIVYAAAAGIPGAERGAVYVASLASATPTPQVIATTTAPDTYFDVTGWDNDGTAQYTTKPGPI